MAVFTLTGSLNVLQDFTTDPQILYAALQRFRPRPQEFASAGRATTSATAGDATTASTVASLDASTAPATDTSGLGPGAAQLVAAAQAAAQSFEAAQVAYAQEQRTMLTLQALNSLGRILGGLPGRKNIIWVIGMISFRQLWWASARECGHHPPIPLRARSEWISSWMRTRCQQ